VASFSTPIAHYVSVFQYAVACQPTGHHYHGDGGGAGSEADGWGSKSKDAAAAAFNSASPRKPNANAIFPGGPVKMFPPQDAFLSENCTIVLAQIGSTPILHCEVADIGEGTVSMKIVFLA
jgi:hypothetical protein